MVRINGLVCLAAAVSTSRSLRVRFEHLLSMRLWSRRHPESDRRRKAFKGQYDSFSQVYNVMGDDRRGPKTRPPITMPRSKNESHCWHWCKKVGQWEHKLQCARFGTRNASLAIHNAAVSPVVLLPRRRQDRDRRRDRDRDRPILWRRHLGRRRRSF